MILLRRTSIARVLTMAVVAGLALLVAASAQARVGVVALALWSQQDVFLSEASQAARIVARRYGHGGPVVVLANSRRRLAAGPKAMVQALRDVDRRLDADRDILFVIMTSHGSPDGIAEMGGGTEGLLSPQALAGILSTAKVRRKVVVVSACFAGIFTKLADPDTLVITAADATHPSFGCQAGAKWTYFGNAFFNEALRAASSPTVPLTAVFADAARRVRARETAEGFDPSNPQIAGGDNVVAALATAR